MEAGVTAIDATATKESSGKDPITPSAERSLGLQFVRPVLDPYHPGMAS